MSFSKGKDCKVTVNAGTQVVGIGTFNISGVSSDILETTEFGDEYKTFCPSLKDSGELTFSGLYDSADTTGQDVLKAANANATDFTDIRFYVTDTSYYEPNQTGTPSSYVNITSWNIGAAKESLLTTDFSCKVSGKIVLV